MALFLSAGLTQVLHEPVMVDRTPPYYEIPTYSGVPDFRYGVDRYMRRSSPSEFIVVYEFAEHRELEPPGE